MGFEFTIGMPMHIPMGFAFLSRTMDLSKSKIKHYFSD